MLCRCHAILCRRELLFRANYSLDKGDSYGSLKNCLAGHAAAALARSEGLLAIHEYVKTLSRN